MADSPNTIQPARATRPAPRALPLAAPARRRWLGPVAAGLVVVAGLAWWLWPEGDATAWRTAAVDEGTVRVAVAATGKLSALSTVEVGSQVSGQVLSVEVDFNDSVQAGQAIARLDPANFQSRLEQVQADLTSALASLDAARANHGEAQAALVNAQSAYVRAESVFQRQLISRADYDTAMAGRDQAQARVASSAAAIKVAQSQVAQRRAAVDNAQLDLDYTVIRSPVDGVVLLRAVEPGQTVAASFQTPVLFTIAEDLRQMQIELTVDESDVGQIREGQAVRFTVDAFPGRNFEGSVRQVRLAATEASTVITYPVIVDVDNGDSALLPGMTASAEVLVSERTGVTRLPNAALRFRPPGAEAAPEAPTGPPSAAQIERMRAQGAEQLRELADTVGLDEGQRQRLQAAMTAMRQQMMARMQAGGGPPAGLSEDARRRRTSEAMAAALQPLRAELDAGQQERLDQYLAQMASSRRAEVWVLDGGAPVARPVRIGLADAGFSEVVSGLAPGDEVLIGVERGG
jgi:HlyD family secretion protein